MTSHISVCHAIRSAGPVQVARCWINRMEIISATHLTNVRTSKCMCTALAHTLLMFVSPTSKVVQLQLLTTMPSPLTAEKPFSRSCARPSSTHLWTINHIPGERAVHNRRKSFVFFNTSELDRPTQSPESYFSVLAAEVEAVLSMGCMKTLNRL